MTFPDLTARQLEVLRAYASVPPREVPDSIRAWLDKAPNHHAWGCRLSGISRVIRYLVAEGFLELDYLKPTVRGVLGLTLKGKRTLNVGDRKTPDSAERKRRWISRT